MLPTSFPVTVAVSTPVCGVTDGPTVGITVTRLRVSSIHSDSGAITCIAYGRTYIGWCPIYYTYTGGNYGLLRILIDALLIDAV